MEESKDLTVFRQARDAAKRRLHKLELEKLSLQATVASLDELLDESSPAYSSALTTALEASPMNDGLTEAVRQILNIVPNTGMQAAEIAKLMEERGFSFGKYPNPVQPVHTVLTRLCTQRDPDAKIVGKTTGGRPLYAPTKRKPMYKQIADQFAEGL